MNEHTKRNWNTGCFSKITTVPLEHSLKNENELQIMNLHTK